MSPREGEEHFGCGGERRGGKEERLVRKEGGREEGLVGATS